MFKLEEIIKDIYLLTFDDVYELCMHFLRYQEYYESPKFKDKNFELVDFMRWYSRDSNVFTYPDDWTGFNIPGEIIPEIHLKGIKDLNRYDRFMYSIYEEIKAQNEGRFYLIGVQTGDNITVEHEIAHGLYYLNEKYRNRCKDLIEAYIKNDGYLEKFKEYLVEMGYHESVFEDEMQAYMATGLDPDWDLKGIHRDPFRMLFDMYKGKYKVKE